MSIDLEINIHYIIVVIKKIFLSVLFIMIVSLISQLHAQDIRIQDKKNIETVNIDSLNLNDDSLDVNLKFEAGYFYLDNIFKIIPYRDSILDDSFPYFDPLEISGKDIIDKGYIGSGAMIAGENYISPGFDLGYHVYDLYEKKIKGFKWYRSNLPFATLFFSPGSNVNEFWTKAKFAKDFKDVSIDLDYSRVVNAGKYTGQNIKHSILNAGFWKSSGKSRFNTFFNFLANIHQEEDNGGVRDLSYFHNVNYSIREVIPVNLKDAVTRMQDYSLIFHEYFKLIKKDVTSGIKPYLFGKFTYSQGFYKFYDKDVSSDSDLLKYGDLLADKIGLRNYIKYSKQGASFGFFGVTKANNYIHTGLDYNFINCQIEPLGDSLVNQLDVYFKGEYGIFNNKLTLDWNAKYFMLDYNNDYLLKANLKYSNTKFVINAGAEIKNASPSLKYQKLWLTRVEIYNNSFSKQKSVKYFGDIKINKIGFSLHLEKSILNNYLYFDESLYPKQSDVQVNLYKLHLKEKIKFSIFNLDLQANIYHPDSDVIPLPKYTLKSKFFISPYLYDRHLYIKTGFEFNYWDKYYNYGYNPAIASFYTQNNIFFDNFMRLDYFFSAKVKSFLFFIRFNNILFPLDDNVQFKVIDYPQSDLFYRLGVKWTLLN